MKDQKEVYVKEGKQLFCPCCGNSKFFEFNTRFEEYGQMRIIRNTLEDGTGYLCAQCGYKLEFFPELFPYLEKTNRKNPKELTIKKKKSV